MEISCAARGLHPGFGEQNCPKSDDHDAANHESPVRERVAGQVGTGAVVERKRIRGRVDRVVLDAGRTTVAPDGVGAVVDGVRFRVCVWRNGIAVFLLGPVGVRIDGTMRAGIVDDWAPTCRVNDDGTVGNRFRTDACRRQSLRCQRYRCPGGAVCRIEQCDAVRRTAGHDRIRYDAML